MRRESFAVGAAEGVSHRQNKAVEDDMVASVPPILYRCSYSLCVAGGLLALPNESLTYKRGTVSGLKLADAFSRFEIL